MVVQAIQYILDSDNVKKRKSGEKFLTLFADAWGTQIVLPTNICVCVGGKGGGGYYVSCQKTLDKINNVAEGSVSNVDPGLF